MAGKESLPPSQKTIQNTAKALLEAKNPHSALLIISLDKVRRERFLNKYLETFAHPAHENSLISSFDCREFSSRMIGEIREASQTLPLFTSNQFIILHYLDSLKANEAKDVCQVVVQAGGGSTIIGVSPKLASASLLFKSFAKNGEVLAFEELKGEGFRRWAERECRQKGVNEISDRALGLLIQLAQGDLDTLTQLIEVAALYAEEKTLSELDIQNLFHISLSHSEFALVDEIVSGNSQRAQLLLAELLREGKSPFGLIAIIARSLSQLITIRLELDAGRSESYIRDILKMPPWQYNKLIPHARRATAPRFKKALNNLLKADIRLKSRSVAIEDILQDVIAPL